LITTATLICLLALVQASAEGQGPPQRPPPPKPETAGEPALKPGELALKSPTDPAVGIVEGHMIYLSDVGRAIATLPENLRGMPFDSLFPVVLDRLIDHQALVAIARREQLEKEPAIQRDIDAATDRVLEGALLAREATPEVTEPAIRALYDKQFADAPAIEEVRASHILVATEAEARKLIAELKKGADFATLARQHSQDPDREHGGELGFFRRDQVWPGFADAAFAMRPGQISEKPIHNEFGWHVVRVEERRTAAPPSYAEMRDKLRQVLTQEAVQRVIDKARSDLTIHKYNLNGTVMGAAPNEPADEPKPQRQPNASIGGR
jgi:peptidyl-prolyl cis-trans isomerase C